MFSDFKYYNALVNLWSSNVLVAVKKWNRIEKEMNTDNSIDILQLNIRNIIFWIDDVAKANKWVNINSKQVPSQLLSNQSYN